MIPRLLSTIVAVILTITAVAAQGTASVRTEVQQFVKSYVDAQNKPDATAVMDMVSRKPGVSATGMGKITRGWEAIRASGDEAAGAREVGGGIEAAFARRRLAGALGGFI